MEDDSTGPGQVATMSIANALPVLVALSVLLAAWVKWYYDKKYSYWTERGISGPKPNFLFGTMLQSIRVGNLAHSRWVEEYGKVYGLYMRTTPMLAIADADCLKDILIRNFHCFTDRPRLANVPLEMESLINQNGPQWKHDRAIMSPTFSSGKMKSMFGLMKDSFVHLDKEFETLASQNVDVDTKSVFSKITTMVIARCAFATEVNAFKDENNILLKRLHSIFDVNTWERIRILLLLSMPKFLRDLIRFSFIPAASLNYLDKICREILKQRRQNPSASNEYPDLLQLLIDTNNNNQSDDQNGNCDQSKGQGFSDMKIIANAILFFIAGYETTSTLLFWSSYALMKNPDVQEKLYREIKEAKDKSGDLDYETLSSIKYLDAFINETLRMYPPVTRLIRQCTQDHTLPNGMLVEKGMSVIIPVYSIHHSNDNYAKADTFDPERFMPENKDNIDPCTFLPFVQGPRNCIGMRFALIEAKMTLANVVLKYQFVKSPNTPDELVFDRNSFILAAKNMPMRVTKRQTS